MSKKRILVVEDQRDDMQLVVDIITLICQHEISQARLGAEAVRIVQEQVFDTVILDLWLPDISGFTIAETLKAMESYQKVPLIALTAYDHAGVRKRCANVGFDAVLVKPIDIDVLQATLNKHLNA